jgi:hypothetical protein
MRVGYFLLFRRAAARDALLLSKEHQKFVTGFHYNLATISLKFRAQITKFQGDIVWRIEAF